jgi:uncharacterized OB-fold protein
VANAADAVPVEPLVIDGHWDFHYRYFAGEAASTFFAGLREGRILGAECPGCHRVLVPARSFCDACFVDTGDWREVGPGGILEAFTILTSKHYGLPEPPVVIGYVTLEGANTALLNFVRGVDLTDLEAAAAGLLRRPPVAVRFSDAPKGRITDFHFVVAGS